MPLDRTLPADNADEVNKDLVLRNQELQQQLDQIQQQLADQLYAQQQLPDQQNHQQNLLQQLPPQQNAQNAQQQLLNAQQNAQQGPPPQQLNNASDPPATGEILAVRNIKMPPFWKDNPAIWFDQVETAFALYRITNDVTKFRYVVLQFDRTVMPYVSDLVAKPPQTDKYKTLKDRIVTSFAETTELKLRRLLRGIDCQDDKPSAILQKIKNLSEGQCSESILRTLFLEQLPDQIRGIVSINE